MNRKLSKKISFMSKSPLLTLICLASLSCLAYEPVAIPNSKALGLSLISTNFTLMNHSSKAEILPKEVRLVVSNGMVDEIQAIYDEKIPFLEIIAALNANYSASEMKDLRSDDFGLWKVVSEKFVIQLSRFKGDDISINRGDRLLILTRISPLSSKGASKPKSKD